jgi:hypothetical protein
LGGLADQLLGQLGAPPTDWGRWLPKHANDAVQYLLNDGRIARKPATGRLTRDSMLRLMR